MTSFSVSSEKRLKIFEYLNNNIHHNGFAFLQETHSLTKDEKEWKDDFKDPLLFSHGTINSCGVAIGFCGLKSLHIIDKKSDQNGRILIIDTKVNNEKFLLINLYNANTESEQIKTLDTLKNLLKHIDNISDKKIILGGDLYLVFDCNLEACGGNPVLKKNSLCQFIEIKEGLNLCDIWRMSFIWFHSNKIGLLFRVKCSARTCEKTDILAFLPKIIHRFFFH